MLLFNCHLQHLSNTWGSIEASPLEPSHPSNGKLEIPLAFYCGGLCRRHVSPNNSNNSSSNCDNMTAAAARLLPSETSSTTSCLFVVVVADRKRHCAKAKKGQGSATSKREREREGRKIYDKRCANKKLRILLSAWGKSKLISKVCPAARKRCPARGKAKGQGNASRRKHSLHIRWKKPKKKGTPDERHMPNISNLYKK